MNDPATAMLVSMFVGTVGFGVFIYGKRQSRFPHLVGGVAMMTVPWLVENPLVNVAVAIAIGLALWVASRFGI